MPKCTAVGMESTVVRAIQAGLLAFVAFLLTTFVGCGAMMYLVRDSHDGQAGMGAALGGIYAGIAAGLVTLVVSWVLSGRRKKE